MDGSTEHEVERQDAIPGAGDEPDVEGHNRLPDAELGRELARARERDIERRLRAHTLQVEAKPPDEKSASPKK
ncbi:MAG: hypothetical protein WCH74_10410 [Chloroflexota bacterium]